MTPFKLLVVEDSPQDLETCKASIARYQSEKQRQIELVECATLEKALATLNNSFDGAIVDLKLSSSGNEGTQVIKRIAESYFRIPIAVFTGTPDSADAHFSYLGVFKKGETSYVELFDLFWGIHSTGLTRIMGGRGVIEKALSEVFLKNILPQKDTWIKHGTSDHNLTETALLRHSLNCLLQLLDNSGDEFFAEEMYIFPPLSTALQTGSIVKRRDTGTHYVVMNPACDLALRKDGKFKTDRILLVDIESSEIVTELKGIQNSKNTRILKKLQACDHHNPESAAYKHALQQQEESLQRSVSGLFKNAHSLYYHWLPATQFFHGGFINFRKLSTYPKGEFDLQFDTPTIQIAPSFVKDIVARFSSFYARQGQPDIDCQEEVFRHLS